MEGIEQGLIGGFVLQQAEAFGGGDASFGQAAVQGVGFVFNVGQVSEERQQSGLGLGLQLARDFEQQLHGLGGFLLKGADDSQFWGVAVEVAHDHRSLEAIEEHAAIETAVLKPVHDACDDQQQKGQAGDGDADIDGDFGDM